MSLGCRIGPAGTPGAAEEQVTVRLSVSHSKKNYLTLWQMRELAAFMKAHAVKPKRIETQEQCDLVNMQSARLSFKWRVGDDYYEMSNLMQRNTGAKVPKKDRRTL